MRTPDPVDGKQNPSQIYLISMDGGEARALTNSPKGASSPVWSPDGRTIAFLSTPDTAKADSSKKSADTTKKHVSDVRVITRAQYRWNGGGYTDVTAHSHIWTVPASFTATGGLPSVKQITSGTFDEGEPEWSPTGRALAYASPTGSVRVWDRGPGMGRGRVRAEWKLRGGKVASPDASSSPTARCQSPPKR